MGPGHCWWLWTDRQVLEWSPPDLQPCGQTGKSLARRRCSHGTWGALRGLEGRETKQMGKGNVWGTQEAHPLPPPSPDFCTNSGVQGCSPAGFRAWQQRRWQWHDFCADGRVWDWSPVGASTWQQGRVGGVAAGWSCAPSLSTLTWHLCTWGWEMCGGWRTPSQLSLCTWENKHSLHYHSCFSGDLHANSRATWSCGSFH